MFLKVHIPHSLQSNSRLLPTVHKLSVSFNYQLTRQFACPYPNFLRLKCSQNSTHSNSKSKPKCKSSFNSSNSKKNDNTVLNNLENWMCIKHCGACCFLDKGPLAPPIEQILLNVEELNMYKRMVGKDGWCIHFNKQTRSCSIYEDRPRFCRVEEDVFVDLYKIKAKEMGETACSFCKDSIRDVYGGRSSEMKTFDRAIRKLKITKKET